MPSARETSTGVSAAAPPAATAPTPSSAPPAPSSPAPSSTSPAARQARPAAGRQIPGPRLPTSDGAVTVQPSSTRRRFRPGNPFSGRSFSWSRPERPGRLTVARPGRIAAVVVLVVAAGAVALAGTRAASQADQVETSMAAATAAARRVSVVGAPLEPASVRTDLMSTVNQDQAVQAERGGFAWTLSRWTTSPSRLGRLDRDADGLTRLAEAGRPLGAALVAATSGAPDRSRLEALAESTAGYAAAARDSGIVMDDGMRPLAVVTAQLPDLAAGPGPRRWTVCTTATGPCESLGVTEGAIVSRRALKAGPPALRISGTVADSRSTSGSADAEDAGSAAPGDLVVIGKGATELISGSHLSVRALIDVLLRTAPGTAAADRTTVRTVVPVTSA